MALTFQVLSLSDLDEVFGFASRRLEQQIPDETERTFASWTVKWRREALEHYLKLGWSFIARRENPNGEAETVGFFLGQPFLFFRGQTQTLWVEHIEAESSEVAEALIDVAARVAREKNLQRALFADSQRFQSELARWKPQPLENNIAEVKTTKGS